MIGIQFASFRRLRLALIVLLVGPCHAQQQAPSQEGASLDKFMADMNACAANYSGPNKQLSPVSKCAVVKHEPDLVVGPYESSCSAKYSPKLRAHYCPLGLLELATFFADPTNDAKDLSRARQYIERLVNEYPDSESARSAKPLVESLGKEVK